MIENIIIYYIILALSFVITSYIVTFRPAMFRSAKTLVELLEKNTSNDFLLTKVKKFVSWPYQWLTIVIYLVAVFIFFPVVAVGTFVNNEKLIEGFSDGLINGLLELNND
jgi:hypothetical protein